jgi:hypothetical protein
MLGAFPTDTFAQPPEGLEELCKETDPRRGAATLKSEIMKATTGREGAAGRVQWLSLAWYELALFSAMQGRCCPSAAPLVLPEAKGCEALDAPLRELASQARGPLAPQTLQAPLERFDAGIRCVLHIGATGHYGRTRAPTAESKKWLFTWLERLERGLQTAPLPNPQRIQLSIFPRSRSRSPQP